MKLGHSTVSILHIYQSIGPLPKRVTLKTGTDILFNSFKYYIKIEKWTSYDLSTELCRNADCKLTIHENFGVFSLR